MLFFDMSHPARLELPSWEKQGHSIKWFGQKVLTLLTISQLNELFFNRNFETLAAMSTQYNTGETSIESLYNSQPIFNTFLSMETLMYKDRVLSSPNLIR